MKIFTVLGDLFKKTMPSNTTPGRVVIFAVFFLFTTGLFAATITSNGTGGGNWNVGGTWSGGSVPGAADDVVIASGDVVTVNTSPTVLSVTVNSGGTLRFGSASGSYTLTMTNFLTNSGTIDTDDGGFAQHTMVIGGNFNNSGGTFNGDQTGGSNLEVVNVTFNGSSAMAISGAPTFYKLTHTGTGALSTGTSSITIKNALDLQNGAGSFTVGSGGLIIEGGTVNILGGTFDATSNASSITFQGTSSKTVSVDGNINGTLTFYDCTVKDADVTLLANNANVAFTFNNTLTLTDHKFIFSASGQTESIAYGSGATLVYNGSSNQVVDVEWTTSVSPTNVTINNASGVQISSGDRTISGALSLTNGELDHAGTLTVNGDVNGGTGLYGQTSGGTLLLDGSSSSNVNVTNSLTLHNLSVNKSAGSTVTVTVQTGGSINTDANATLHIIQGTLSFSTSSQLNLGATNTLQIDANGILETGGTDISGFSTYTLAAGSTVRFTGTTAETVPAQTYGNLTINKSGSEATLGGNITLTVGTSINSTLYVQAGALNLNGKTLTLSGTGGGHILQVDNGATLRTADAAGTVTGTDITGFATYTFGTSSTVMYNGSGAQENLAGGSPAVAYGNLYLDNSSGFNGLSSSNMVAVNGTVTFSNGVVTTTAGSQFVLNAGAQVSGGSATSHVSGPMQKQYDGSNLGGTATADEIPVGKSGVFRPINIQFASISSGTVTITAEQINSDPITSNDPPSGYTDSYDGRYWTIVESGGATHGTATVVLDYNGYSVSAPNNVRIIQGSDADGANYVIAGSYSSRSGTLVTHTGVSDFSTNTRFTFATIQATKYWDGGGSDSYWSTAANWNDDVKPSPGDIVILEHTNGGVAGAYTVTLNSAESIGDLTIDPESGNAITLQITANSLTISGAGEALTMESGATLTINGPTGDGISMSGNGDINIKNGATYNLNTGTGISTSGTRTFGSTSTTSIASTTDGALKAATYGDLTLTHSSGTLSVSGNVSCQNFTMDDVGSATINGTFSIAGTLTKSGSGTLTVEAAALSVSGAITTSGGTIKTNGTGGYLSASSTITNNGGTISLEGTGNSSVTGAVSNNTGTVSISGSGTATFSSTVTNTASFTVTSTAGNVSFAQVDNNSGGTLTLSNGNGVTFNGAYSGAGTISASGSGSVSFESTFSPSGSCTFASQALTLKGNVNVSGGTLTPSTNTSFTGTDFQISGSGALSNTTGAVTFAGTAGQTITDNSSNSLAFNDVTINNSNDITLNDPVTIDGALTLTSGDIKTTSTNLLTFGTSASVSDGSNSSHINGPAAKNTNSTNKFVFPLGNGSRWRRLAIEPGSSTAGTYTAQYFFSDPHTAIGSSVSNTGDTNLDHISNNQYWKLERTSGSPSPNVSLYWEDASDGVDENLTVLLVAQWINGSSYWESRGGSTSGGLDVPGSVRSNAVTSLESGNIYFTFGSSTTDNSLPVELASFEASADYGKVTLNWSTASEVNNQGFNIYRKTNATQNWQQLNADIIPGQGNSSQESNYTFVDEHINAGATYFYKLESVSMTGVRVEEKTIEVAIPVPTDYALLNNYPNPFNPTTHLRFRLPEAQRITLSIYDMRGQLIKHLIRDAEYAAGEYEQSWDATDMNGRRVSSGMYLYVFKAGAFQKVGKMVLLK